MQIEVDSFLTKGKNKAINKDYIIHGTEPFPYIILADGCSSSPHTDIGARIICHSIKKTYKYGLNVSMEAILDTCDSIRKCLGIPQESLDCTVITCTIKDEIVHIDIYGDGSCFIEFNNGSYRYNNISFPNNAPFYPNYFLNEQRMKNYPNDKLISTCIVENGIGPDRHITEKTLSPHYSFYDFDSVDRVKSVIISSDGLNSFGLSFDEAYQSFSNFKTTKGEFIKRRAKRALKELADVGYHNYDDISIGGMYLCHNTTSQK